MKWESLVKIRFYGQQMTAFQKREGLVGECKNSGFLHSNAPQFFTKLSLQPTPISISAATKITRSFPFNKPLAASSPHCNVDFSQNPILR